MGTHMTLRRYGFTFLTTAAVSCLQMAEAQPETDAPTTAARAVAPENYVLRTYEVGDLILNIQDHPYSESLERMPPSPVGGFGGGAGGGFFNVQDDVGDVGGGGVGAKNQRSAASITIDDFRRVITTTVAFESWSMTGGLGQIEPLGTALVVWQTPAVHIHIQELLKQIRQGSADRKTVTIDARWLRLNSDELENLLLPDQEGVPQVDRKLLAEFTRRPGSIRGMTNCFSSQLVYLVSGTRRNVVTSYIPVVGSLDSPDHGEQLAYGRRESPFRFVSGTPAIFAGNDSKVGYQPVIERPNFGALLEIRPTLMRIDDTAVIDLKSTLTVPGEQPPDLARIRASASIAPPVDRLAIDTQEFVTTLRIPLGKPILVGGLTYEPISTGTSAGANPKKPNPAGGAKETTTENRQLYFVLEVR